MKLGANSILFGNDDMETTFKYLSAAGYDGIEMGAIPQMADHLDLSRWREQVSEIKGLSQTYGLELLAMEQPRQDLDLMEQAFQAAIEIGIPIVNVGPGGKSDEEETLQQSIDSLGQLADRAEHYGVTLCVKAHVGAAIYNTPTSLRVLDAITSPAFGLDMDPSHIYRAGEDPVEALGAVISRIKHVHIRDCKSREDGMDAATAAQLQTAAGHGPGDPPDQANGRGDIDLLGYVRILHEHNYTGPLNLEVIGTRAKGYTTEQCCIIAAESRGHMQACLQACGAR
jgi:sugar phosphate isomerase/epimerase